MRVFYISLFLVSSFFYSYAQPWLILAPQGRAGGGISTLPNDIINNISYIETLPFDGLSVYTVTAYNQGQKSHVTYDQIYNEIKGLKGIFKKFKHNFIINFLGPHPDFFDDWTAQKQDWANFAKAAKDAGLEGIIFDNEEYDPFVYGYPEDVKYSSTKTLDDYRAQARLRGKESMDACRAVFPDIKIIVYHGPYVSEPKFPGPGQSGSWTGMELAGPFFVGMVQATVGNQAMIIDGGEVYALRTQQEFENHYQWRKYTIASSTNNSPNIPTTLRTQWPNKVSISFGVYNQGWSAPMSPSIMRTTVEYSLKRCDHFVWLYTDGWEWYNPNSTLKPSADWIDAIRAGRQAAMTGIHFTCQDNATVSAGSAFTFTITYSNYTTSQASLVYSQKPSWITATNGNPAISGTAPAAGRTDTLVAIVSAGGFSDTLKLSIIVAIYSVIEAESGTLSTPMEKGNDANASGGQYIIAPAGSGNTISPKTEATYSVNIAQAGSYYVWLRIYKQTINPAGNYGTFVGFNGTLVKPGIANITAAQYEWIKGSGVFTLTAGANQLILGHGNEQVRIDKIIITNSSGTQLPTEVTSSLPLDKKNLAQKPDLNICPKSNGNIEFTGTFVNNALIQLTVVDITGRTVWSYNREVASDRIIWNTKSGNSKISNGLYYVLWESQKDRGLQIKKFVLVR